MPHVTLISFNKIYLNLVSWSNVFFHVTCTFEIFATTITPNWTIFILNVNFQFVLSLVHLRTVLTFEIFAQTLCFVTCGTIVRHSFPTFFAGDFFVFSFLSLYLQPSPDGEFTLLTRKLAFIMFCNHVHLQFIVTRNLKFVNSARNHAAFGRLVDVKLLQKCLLKTTLFFLCTIAIFCTE